MGRLLAVVLVVLLMVPAWLLARGWYQAAGRRAVAAATLGFVPPSGAGLTELARQAAHGRRVRKVGVLLGAAAIVGSAVALGEASVLLWVPLFVGGLLGGVLLTEATRPRPRWQTVAGAHPRRRDQLAPGLPWAMRAAVVGTAGTALALAAADDLPVPAAAVLVAVPVLAALVAELALARILWRPLPVEGVDVPVDEAQRTWTAHLVTAAASVLGLLPLGVLLLVSGVELGGSVARDGAELLPVALVAAGLSAFAAGLAVAGFLLGWLRPARAEAVALA